MSPKLEAGSKVLSVCIIARDNARTIGACLESIRDLADEIIVVDTGSTDDTIEIAERLGARVIRFPWVDDFSAARNESLRHARGAWIFWMDTDDTITLDNARKLRELVCGSHLPNVAGYIIKVCCPAAPGEPASDFEMVDHVKLFRNDSAIRFEDRVHEQVLPSIRRLGGDVVLTDIYVNHSGSDQSPEGQRRKCERDLRLLHIQLEERPYYSFGLFNLGMTYSYLKEPERAIEYLERCLALSDPTDSPVRKVYALLVVNYARLGRRDRALEICQTGRRFYPKDPELLFRQGLVLLELRRYVEAEQSFRGALRNDDDPHLSSMVVGIVSFLARHNLAVTYQEMGRLDLAECQLRQVLDEAPDHLDSRRLLVTLLLKQGRTTAADIETTSWLRELPNDPDGWEARSLFLFVHGPPDDAQTALQRLIELRPDDWSAHHNLGLVLLGAEKFDAAVLPFRDAIRLCPDNLIIWHQLGQALEGGGREAEAANWWSEAIRHWPDEPAFRQSLARLEQKGVALLPPCHSRRFLRQESQRFFCAHPMVHSKGHVVTAAVCGICARWQEAEPEALLPFPGPDYLKRSGSCANLGVLIEERPCTTCRGNVRLKVYVCAHPKHKETTISNCELCSDYQAREASEFQSPLAT